MNEPRQSPHGGEDDRLSFSLSEDGADDTEGSLEIKPPQAVMQRKPARHKRDKFSRNEVLRHVHSKGHHSRGEDKRKDYKIERSHKEREVHYRESHKHKPDHRERDRSRGDREHIRQKKDMRGYKGERGPHERRSKDVFDEYKPAEQLLSDLRGKLLDKRGVRESMPEEFEKKRSKRDKDKGYDGSMETEREREERLQRDERKAKLLEAEREMAMRKEVSRRELEARRERHNLEKEKDRMLKEIAKKHKMERAKEKEKHKEKSDGEEEGEIADKSEEEDSDSSSSSSTTTSDEEGTDKEDTEEASPPSAQPMAISPRTPAAELPTPERTPERKRKLSRSPYRSKSSSISRSRSRTPFKEPPELSNTYYAPDSPKSDIVLKDTLPPYLPAIQGCRSVEEFQCLNKIEEGTYGVVYRARDKRTSDIVALKRLKMEKEKEGFPITSLREINTLLKAQHPNIVTVREIVVGSNMDKIFIVMDYVEHDLKSLMETMKSKKQVFVPGEIKCIMMQLLRAVGHLHDNWILHRDLKTSNLLLSHKGVLKVGDFGLAREYGSPLKPYTPIVVTLWYRAPELLLQCKEYTIAIDMWSVGCIFGELLQMEALFCGRSEMDQLNRIFKELGTPNEKIWPGYSKLPAIQKITFTEYPVNRIRNRFGTMLSDLGIGMLNSFLTYDPVQRITAETALQHDFFKEVPLPIDPAMFPTWPAKSEQGIKKVNNSPKPPSGGKEYKQLGDSDEEMPSGGFHMGAGERRANVMGPGFSLKF